MIRTRVEGAPLPNGAKGGFLKLMGDKKNNKALHSAEWEALDAKHAVEREKLKQKHAAANKPAPTQKSGKK